MNLPLVGLVNIALCHFEWIEMELRKMEEWSCWYGEDGESCG